MTFRIEFLSIYFAICLFLSVPGMAQGNTPIHALKIGDTLPDFSYSVNNYASDKLRFSGLRKKLIILDFWGVWCSACIASIPRMEKLQQEFDGDLLVIMVTKDSEKAVSHARTLSGFLRNTRLPMINADTILSRFFPFETVPTHVWIDTLGIVRHISNGYNTTENHVRAFLENKALALPEKKELLGFDPEQPLWLEGNGRQRKHLLYYSYIMNSIEGVYKAIQGGEVDSLTGKPIRVYALNHPILSLYKIAYNGLTGTAFDFDNRCLLKCKNPEDLRGPGDYDQYDEWAKEHLFSYDLKIPVSKSGFLYRIMQQDLDRFFGLQSGIEKTRVPCLVLKRIGRKDLIHTRGAPANSMVSEELNFLSIRNLPIASSLVRILGILNSSLATPILDGTHYKANIDITLEGDLKNIAILNGQLKKYGLELVKEDRILDILVIRDR